MKKIIITFILMMCLFCTISNGQKYNEYLANFGVESVPVLNEILRKIWYEINALKNVEKYAALSAATFNLGATAPTIVIEGTFPVLQFSNARTESAYVSWHIPIDWKKGTDIKIAYYWTPTDGNAGHVAWEVDWESVASEMNEPLGAGSTNVEIHDDTQSSDNELLETSYGIILGSAITEDDTIGFCISRDHDDTDTYGAKAALVHMEIEYISDRRGESI